MQISTRGIVNLCLPCVVSRKYNQYLICMYLICIYVIGNEKKHILELFNMILSKTIDQTRICKKSYGDPLGYFCMGLFVLLVPTDKWPINFTCPTNVSICLGQTLLSRPAFWFIPVENWSIFPIVLISRNTKASKAHNPLTTPSQAQVNQRLLVA
jgi:hypothetical protein